MTDRQPGGRGLPTWKIKREIMRVVYQADDLMLRLFGTTAARFYTRWLVDPKVRFLPGALPLGRKVAIYLIFPESGLLESHRRALAHIYQGGYAPVVVSNLPLTEAAQAELQAISAQVILRPNFGYDFGGYRDAMRFLAPQLPSLDYLAIFNDSSWFPVRTDFNWLAVAEAKGWDYTGSVSHEGLPSLQVQDFRTVPFKVEETREFFHYGSFSLLIGRRILGAPEFLRFWQRYAPTDRKDATVRRGEIGLTQSVMAQGFTHGAVCDSKGLDQALDRLPTDRLREIVVNLIDRAKPELVALRAQALAADPPDRAALVNAILASVAFLGPSYALIEYDLHERQGMFVKKAPIRQNRPDAEATLRVLAGLQNPAAEAILDEARALFAARWGAPPPV